MDIVTRMFITMDEKNLKAAQLAEYLNINKSVVSTWKSRSTNPPLEYTERICEFLDITYEFYITGKNSFSDLTNDEKKLLDNYRNCNELSKNQLLSLSESLSLLPKEDKGNSSTSKTG